MYLVCGRKWPTRKQENETPEINKMIGKHTTAGNRTGKLGSITKDMCEL